MSHSLRNFRVPVPGILAGAFAAAAASPALAASTFVLQNTLADFGTREWLLAGSLVLLVLALAGRLLRGRAASRDVRAVEEAPDLRWWRNAVIAGY